MVRLIAEIGSTHDGEKAACIAAIENAAETGIKDVKFQLLEPEQIKETGNISIKPSWLPDLIRCGNGNGVNVFASVWSDTAMALLHNAGANTVKIAYSMNLQHWLIKEAVKMFPEVIVSGDIMHRATVNCIELYCIPLYPVPYEVSFVDGLFPMFAGFSDHTLGIRQSTIAALAGAKIIEKHVFQNENSRTPDRRFAISWKEMEKLHKKLDKELVL